jgi:hypothetical protein
MIRRLAEGKFLSAPHRMVAAVLAAVLFMGLLGWGLAAWR